MPFPRPLYVIPVKVHQIGDRVVNIKLITKVKEESGIDIECKYFIFNQKSQVSEIVANFTDFAPAFFKILLHKVLVAPVVFTSSTSKITLSRALILSPT